MDLGLKDKLIVIAGGRGELGLAETTRTVLEREGALTVLLDDGSAKQVRATDFQIDLGDRRAFKGAFNRLRKKYASIAGYVSMVAGPLPSVLPGFRRVQRGHLQEQTEQTYYPVVYAYQEMREWAEVLDVPPMIVVWSSVNGLEKYALNEFAYDGAQSSVIKSVGNAAVYSRGKMYVVGVACGTLDNPLWEQSGQQEALKLIVKAIPDGRVTTLEEAAEHVAFYLSRGHALNGETISLARSWGRGRKTGSLVEKNNLVNPCPHHADVMGANYFRNFIHDREKCYDL